MRYFDDQAKDGTTPTYSWKKMNICNPFDSWGYDVNRTLSDFYTDPVTVVSGGVLYVGVILDPGHFRICSKYNMDSREWEDLENRTNTEYVHERVRPSMVELDGYIYVIGGNDYESCRSINKYDTVNNYWVDCCDLKSGVAECSLVIMDKKVLILDTRRYDQREEHDAIIQMYDPAKNESFIVLDAAGLEKDGLRNEDLQLTVQGALCYVICDPELEKDYVVTDSEDSDGESSRVQQNLLRVFEHNPRVFKLVCNLYSDSPSVILGEEIPQTHPHRSNYIRAFCIEGKTFINVQGCVLEIKDGIKGGLKKWRHITKTSVRPVHFTSDRRDLRSPTQEEEEEYYASRWL